MAESRLTVVQMLPALDAGGVERGTLEVSAELVRRGHRAIVIAAGGRLVPPLTSSGAEHVDWPVGVKSPLTMRWVPKLRRLLAREDVTILHARSRLPAWVAFFAWRGMAPERRPHFVTTVHGHYSANRYSAIMTRGETVITPSRATRDYVLENYPVSDPERIRVIHRGIDRSQYSYGLRPSPEWQQDWYREYPMLEGRYVIALAGRITRRKGHADLVPLIAKLREHGVDAHGLVVGGSGQDAGAQRLLKVAAQHQVRDALTLVPQRTDLRNIFAVSNVVVSLSRKPESFGRTVLESLSVGVPAAGYDHGGVGEQLAEILPEGRVPVGDVDAMSRLLKRWAKHPPRLPEHHPFTLERMLDQTLDVYLEMAHPT